MPANTILITGPIPEKVGGVSNYLSILIPRLNRNVTYFNLGLLEEDQGKGAKLWKLIRDLVAFFRIVRNNEFELVHINPSFVPQSLIRDSLLLFLARLYGNKTLVFFHGWDRNFAAGTNQLPWRLFRNLLLRSDSCVVLAGSFEESLKLWGYNGKVFREATIIDEDLIKASLKKEVSEDNRKVKNYPTILFLSRLEKEKGLFEAIECCKILKKTFPELKLVIAGDGAAKQEACEQCIDDSWISFTGYVTGKEKYDLYRQADLYLFPSYREGMPTSVLEAMAFGVAIVSRPVGGLEDFFDETKMGTLVPDFNPGSFAEACDRLLASPDRLREIHNFNSEFANNFFNAAHRSASVRQIYDATISDSIPEKKEDYHWMPS